VPLRILTIYSNETLNDSNHIHNFNAGPSILPESVLREAAASVTNLNQSGLSILEIGHRTPTFTSIMEEAQQLVRDLMQLSADHEVLFLHGGASTQFMQVPMNLLDAKETAAYADTGVWSSKAIHEAKAFGKVDVVCSSKEQQYTCIPDDFAVPHDAKYFHITTNNTIYGTQWHKIPHTSNVMVADMSSDIFSRKLRFSDFGLIYAGAQKNIGPAGTTLVVVRKDLLGKVKRHIPTILDYRMHIAEKSMLNTPPVFAIYVCMLTLRWIKESGGLDVIEKQNKIKADLLYAEIDRNELFIPRVMPKDRSLMNVCFQAIDESVESRFLTYAKEQGIVGIKGHRLAGAFRASLYNALPLESVHYLTEVMKTFTQKQG
jgi:phosphoserine aminotransferase